MTLIRARRSDAVLMYGPLAREDSTHARRPS